MSSEASPTSDGRTRRSERSREQIVRALLDLVGEGVPLPTALQVAERAGVGMRTVFRHFSDMETLFAAMGEVLRERERNFLEERPPEGSFDSRAQAFATRRAAFYERMAPYQRATDLQRGRSAYLRDDQTAWARILRDDLGRWMPELNEEDSDFADAFTAATSFASWGMLRQQGASAKRCGAALQTTTSALCLLRTKSQRGSKA